MERNKLIIPINNKYRIASDQYQWIVQSKRTRSGLLEWEARYFYATFRMALGSLGELMVRESKAETLAEALIDVENITTMLSLALTPFIEASPDEAEEDHDGE